MEAVNKIIPFNSPIEMGLRLLFLFKNTEKEGLDLQRLIYYNYLLVHTSDVSDLPGAPKSLHPNLPDRSGEILISRKIIESGVKLLLSKGLICIGYTKTGIKYKRNDETKPFLEYFESKYSKELDKNANWICQKFDKLQDEKLNDFMTKNLGKWGSEFSIDYRVMGDENA
jgi:hypothetical protein